MSFFHSNSSGKIIYRFSRDIGKLDDETPNVVFSIFVVRNLSFPFKNQINILFSAAFGIHFNYLPRAISKHKLNVSDGVLRLRSAGDAEKTGPGSPKTSDS